MPLGEVRTGRTNGHNTNNSKHHSKKDLLRPVILALIFIVTSVTILPDALAQEQVSGNVNPGLFPSLSMGTNIKLDTRLAERPSLMQRPIEKAGPSLLQSTQRTVNYR